MKYFYFELKERNGEREYQHKMVRSCDDINETPVSYATDVAKQFYAGGFQAYNDYPDTFWFDSGEVYVQVYKAEEISELEYKIMSKYL